ncbi:MAG: hypothetical protein M3P33_02625 [bacterium]|nr:hypothetical protein [bacterium]
MQKSIKYSSLLSILFLVLVISGCTPASSPQNSINPSSNTQSHDGEVKDQVSLIGTLKRKNIDVAISDAIEQPFLRAKGTQLTLNGLNIKDLQIQVFSYDYTDLKTNGITAAQEDISNIEPNGDPKTTKVLWVGGPHWYHKERIIVLYTGDDKSSIYLLDSILGKQFAGK